MAIHGAEWLSIAGCVVPIHTLMEQEVAQLIVDSLHLHEVDPTSIQAEAPLFNEGLGLDSIDALELSLAIKMKYGFQIKSSDTENVRIFSSLRALAQHIEQHRTQ